MKYIFLILSLISFASSTNAQKIDFDNYIIPVEFVQLPKHYTNPDNRTIQLHSNLDQSIGLKIENMIAINGFHLVNQGASIDAYITAYPLVQGNANPSNRVVEEKNKEGKVTRRYSLYKVSVNNSCSTGSYKILGPKSESAKELEKRKQEDKKEKPKKEANPFLKDVAENGTEEKETAQKQKVFQMAIWPTYTYETRESNSSFDASDEFRLNKYKIFTDHQAQYSKFLVETVNYHLNELYGFPAIVQKIKFQVTDSEKHPEDKNYKQALEAIKVILSKLKYNSNTETAKVELQPVIDYFTSLKKKYKSDEKGDMKIKHWTGWNLAQLYLCLDDIESASVEAKYLIALDYEKSDGEKLLEEINDIKEDFKRIQVNTRRLKEVE